jgi:hypothetical protein
MAGKARKPTKAEKGKRTKGNTKKKDDSVITGQITQTTGLTF